MKVYYATTEIENVSARQIMQTITSFDD